MKIKPVDYCPRCGEKGHREPECPLIKVPQTTTGLRRLRAKKG